MTTKTTKPKRSEQDRFERQHFWLSILLIVTCVALITSILVISFFVHREIFRRGPDLHSSPTESHAKLRGDHSKASASISVDLTTTSTISPTTITKSFYKTSDIATKFTIPKRFEKLREIESEDRTTVAISIQTTKEPPIVSNKTSDTLSKGSHESEVDDFIVFPESESITEIIFPHSNITESTTSTLLARNDTVPTTSTHSPIKTDRKSLTGIKSLRKFGSPIKGTIEKTTLPTVTRATESVIASEPEKREIPMMESVIIFDSPTSIAKDIAILSVNATKKDDTHFEKYVAPRKADERTPIASKDTEASLSSPIISSSTPSIRLSSMPLDLENKTDFMETYISETLVTKPPDKSVEEMRPPIRVCDTITCKRSASKMLALIDHNLDPCDDFYSYACRGIEVNRLKDPRYENVFMEKLDGIVPVDDNTKKFKQFYDSCANFNFTQGFQTMKRVIDDIFYKSDTGDKRDSLTIVLTKMLQLDPMRSNFGLLPMFDFTMIPDSDGVFVPTLTVPSTEVRRKVDIECIRNLSTSEISEININSIYDQFENCVKDIDLHLKHLLDTKGDFHGYLLATKKADKILESLKTLPEAPSKRYWNEHISKIEEKPVYFKIKDLHEKYPQINWAILLYTAFKGKETKVTQIRFMFKDYLDKILDFYKKNTLGDLSYILRTIFTYDLYMEIFGEYNKYNVKEYCLRKTMDWMDDLATQLLLTTTNRKDVEHLETIAKEIFVYLKSQFKSSIRNSAWINDAGRNALFSKLDKLELVADIKNTWFNDQAVKYRNDKIVLTNDYVENIVSLKRNKRALVYNKIENDPTNTWLFDYNSLSTKFWSNLKQNKIILPPGLLMKLAFKKRRSPQLFEIYAQLGFQISRGIATFFEPKQLKALIPDIEENETYKNYLHIRLGDPQIAKAKNNYEILASKEDLILSQNSRFSDDLSIRLTMDTYNKTASLKDQKLPWLGYTNLQNLYLVLAQQYCKPEDSGIELALSLYEDVTLPEFFRINSYLMNSIGFSDVYHCPLGSTMNPPFKADAFPYITYAEIDYL